MNFIIFSICFIFISTKQLDAVSLCAGKNVTSQPVINYCDSQNGTLIYRCCRSSDTHSFLAIDLMDSNITKIPDFTQIENFNLSVIDFRNNDLLTSSPDIDFLTLKYLDDLILPEQFECPGGEHVWEEITKINDTQGLGNRCRGQKDICSNSTDMCVEKDSICSANGPNHFLCLCKTGYHGYKCLRNGKFPTAVFFGSTVAATVVLSIILYWTQRRHVIK